MWKEKGDKYREKVVTDNRGVCELGENGSEAVSHVRPERLADICFRFANEAEIWNERNQCGFGKINIFFPSSQFKLDRIQELREEEK